MKKKFTFLMAALMLLTMMVLPGKAVGQTTNTYEFNSKSWGATCGSSTANWTSGKDGSQMHSGRGVQVTTSSSGANATSPVSFNNISQIIVTYSTNKNDGAGSIEIQVGSNAAVSKDVTKSGGTTDRTLTWDYSTNQSGSVKLTVSCTTNSIYVKSVAITYNPKVETPTFSPVAGNYASSQNVSISTATAGATIHYTTNGDNPTTSSSTYSTTITVSSGTMTIKALAVKEGLANSDIATAVYTIVTPRELRINSAHGDVTVTVNSEEVELTSGYYSIPEGATVNLSATPAANYAFNEWTVNSGGVTIENNSFDMPAGDVTITANYIATTTHQYDFSDINKFYLASTGDNHPVDAISYSNSDLYYGADRDMFTVYGSDNCKFTQYSSSYYFIFGKSGAYIKLPTFEGYKIIKVVLHSSSGCSQSVGVQIVDNNGTTVSETQTWSTQNADYTYDIPTSYQKSNLTVKIATNHNAQITSMSIVCVELPSYTLNIGTPSNGSIAVTDKDNTPISSGASVKEGSLVKLTATPADGYAFSAFTVAGSSVEITTDGNNGTFNMPGANITVNATFAEKKILTYKANGGTGDDVVDDYAAGTNVELKDGGTIFTAPANHYFTNWNEKSDGSGTPHAAGSDFTINDNTTLFAQWSNLYNVAVSAVEGAVVSVSYGSSSTIAEGGNADVEYGTLITLNHDLGANKTVVWTVTTGGDPVDVENNTFTVPAANVTVAGVVKDIYTITFNINGDVETIAPVNVIDGNSIDLTAAAYQASMTGYTFVGWSTTQGSSTTIASPATYTPTGNVTLYSVFKKVSGEGTINITKDSSGMPSKYNASATEVTENTYKFAVVNVGTSYASDMQIKNGGSIYNKDNFGNITEIEITYSKNNVILRPGTLQNPTSEDPIDGDDDGESTCTYDLSGGSYPYFVIQSSGGATNLTNIKITYEASSTVVFISSACTITEDIEDGEIVTVGNGGILTFTGDNKGDASNLVIEDGGQISVSNTGVQATFQKSVTGFGSLSKEDENPYNDNYKLIAKPTVDDETNVLPANIGNMLTTDPNNYDLYYFDENKNGAEWRNYKVSPFTINNGQGYLYANSEDVILNFAGEVPTATTKSGIELSYTSGNNFAGFNLFGNPFAVNITSMKINTTPCGYYKLENDGTFTSVPNVALNPVAVGQGFMVEAEANTDKLHLNPVSKDEESFSNESIRLEVANSKYTDVAYICFGNMMPLTKINHMNEEAPMIYIHNEKSDKAVAVYNNRGEVKSFNVNFVAKTTGRYTISGKMMNGEVKYMHFYDRLTGVDTDLLTDSYTFIGAKGDNAGRFILNLESVDNGSSTGSETFAWQSGSEIIVDGEGTLEVYDVTGRKVMNAVVNGAHKVSGLNNGLYIFKLNGKTQKIIVR